MITQKQLQIFEIFAKKPFAEFTRKEIKKESKCTSNNTLALAINLLKKEDVLLEKKIGNSGILTLNLNNDLTFDYIALCNHKRVSSLPLEILKEEIGEETHFYSMVIFGSYASGKQKKESDLDIALFVERKEVLKKIEALANSAKLKSSLAMDIHVIPKAEMIEMLTNKEENLGKQIARKHLTAFNHRIFYDILKEGMDHGFRI